jgi:DNA modification methylase
MAVLYWAETGDGLLRLRLLPGPRQLEVTKEMNIENWPLSRIRPFEKNARKIPQSAINKVAASLEQYRARQPIVVDPDGVIVVGHVRRLAALKLGWKEFPVHVADNLTPEQIRAYRLMDNRSHEETDWDLGLLVPELTDLGSLSFDLSLTGFDPGELERLQVIPIDEETANQAPPVPEVAVSRPGDLWLLGAHRVLCGDATSADAVEKLLVDQRPVLMVTDPPFGISLDGSWRDRAGLNGYGPAEPPYVRQRTPGHVTTTISGDTRADWSEAYMLVPSVEAAYVWHASVHANEVLDGLLRIGFCYPQQIIWNKGRMVLTRTHYWYQHEPCWYVRKKNAPWFGVPGENSTVWDSPSPKFMLGASEEQKFDHPTQKPVELMRRPILNHLRKGELVYDGFLGSGTTLVAAELTERVCFGMEIDPKYVDVIVARWEQLTGKTAVLDGDSCSFAEIKRQRLEN